MTTRPGYIETVPAEPPPGRAARLLTLARGKLVGGTSVVLGTVIISNILRIVSSVILTRLLNAEALGITAITTSIAFVVVMISDLGFYSFIMRHAESHDRRFLDEIWTIRVVRSFVLVGVFLALAKPVALYVQDPRLEAVFWISSLSFLVESFSSFSSITAVRDGHLRRLSLLEIISAVVLLAANVVLALWLKSYWALLIGAPVAGLVKVVLSYAMFPGSSRRFVFNGARMKELWSFSRYIAASSTITLILSQTDKLVLARALTLDSFGKYSLAGSLAGVPMLMASSYVQKILYPAYVRAAANGAGEAGIALVYYRQKRLANLLYAFAVGGVIGGAYLIVAILYDARYASVAPYIQILSVSTLLKMSSMAAEEALIASGRPKITLLANVARMIWLLFLCTIAIMMGRPQLLVFIAGLSEVPAMFYYWVALRRVGIFSLREEMMWMLASVAGGAIGLTASLAARHIL